MRLSFLQLHKLASYLLVAVGFLALLVPNVLHPLMWPLVLGVGVISWRMELPRIAQASYRQRWTQLTAAIFVGCIGLLLFGILHEPILVGAYLLILLQLNKLCNRLEKRDYLHLYLLSFLMLTLGSVLNVELSYGVLFILYIVFATWALILFQMRRELEDTQLMRHEEDWTDGERVGSEQILHSRSLIRGSFLVSTSLLALLVFLGSSVFFVVFPRVGFRMFFHRKNENRSVVGLSDRVRLGAMGRIETNRQVVLRVEIPGDTPNRRLTYYWRGLSFDHYDGRAWSRSQKRRDRVRFGGGSRHLVRRIPEEEEDNLVQQVIFQEPLPINVIFGIDTIYRVQIPNTFQEAMRGYAPAVYREHDSDSLLFTYPPKEQSGIRTIVTSVPSSFLPLAKRLKKKQKQRWLRLFTQLPPDLSPRVKALAEQITQGRQSVVRKVQAIEEYLRKNYAYSLIREAEKTNPVEDFLFLQKKGHCEYFSTAMILLLRSLGIPARQVTGFYGAEWNPYGQYYIVRQSHAHSWGEYLDPKRGWYRFDPTPYRVNDSPPKLSFFAWFEDRLDALRLQWYKWIVEFNLEDQLAAFRAIAAGWRSATDTLGLRGGNRFYWQFLWERWRMPLGGGLLIVLLLGLLIFYRRRKIAPMLSAKQAASQVTLAYARLLRALALRGWVRQQAETPLEFLQRLMTPLTTAPDASLDIPSVAASSTKPQDGAQKTLTQEDLAVIEQLTHRYLILRFGEEPVLAGEIASLEAATETLVQRLALETNPSS